METDFRTLLTSNATLTALVPTGRISWKDNDQDGDNPRISFMIVSEIPGQELGGEDGYVRARIQVDIYADTDPTLISVKTAVNNVLKNVVNQTVGATKFFEITRANRVDKLQAPKGQQRGERRVTLDFNVHYKGN